MNTADDLDRALAAVIADPHSDGPREECADAFDRIGDGARAQFIRLQIETTRRERANGADWEPAREANNILRAGDHRARWAGRLGELVGLESCWFFRGFVEKIRIDARTFLDKADQLFALAPIRRLTLTNVAPVIDKLFASTHLERIVSLTLADQDIGDRGVAVLASSSHLSKLAYLHLAGNGITGQGVVTLMQSKSLPSLRYADLVGNPGYDECLGPTFFEDQGQVVWYNEELEIETQYGRKTWLHTVQDLGRSYVYEGPY
jgi:uncharacterized protein (TIGR02996 family)